MHVASSRVVAAVPVMCAMAACTGVLGLDLDQYHAQDAGSDASGSDAGAATFCSTPMDPAPTFCADFDGPSLVAGWDNVVVSAQGTLGTLREDDQVFRSSPHAARFSAGPLGNELTFASLGKFFRFLPATLRVELAIQFDEGRTTSGVGPEASLVYVELKNDQRFEITWNGREAWLRYWDCAQDAGPPATSCDGVRWDMGSLLTAYDAGLTPNTWHELAVEYADVPYSRVRVWIEDNLITEASLPRVADRASPITLVSVGIPDIQGPSGEFSVVVDNVRIYTTQ